MSSSTHNQLTDLVVEGFERLDNRLLERRAPKITWMPEYRAKEPHVKVKFLEKLAATMNHAAKLVSEERDNLVKLLVLKDRQLEVMDQKMTDNTNMLQFEVTRMNEYRQACNDEVRRLNTRIRDLENADND